VAVFNIFLVSFIKLPKVNLGTGNRERKKNEESEHPHSFGAPPRHRCGLHRRGEYYMDL
jgi:hypothetical protein